MPILILACPRDADRAHEQAHPGFLLREDVFDEGAGFRSTAHWPATSPRS